MNNFILKNFPIPVGFRLESPTVVRNSPGFIDWEFQNKPLGYSSWHKHVYCSLSFTNTTTVIPEDAQT